MKYTSQLIALSLLALGSLNASAAVYYSQNFDSLTLGSIGGQTDSGPLAPSATWSGSALVENTVAVSGQALQVETGGANYRQNPFDSNVASTNQILQFDYRLQSTPVGPNLNIQNEVQARGPLVNQMFFFLYKGITDSGGAIVMNEFRLNYNGFTNISSTAPTANVWYRVTFDINYSTSSIDALVYDLTNSTIFWDPAAVTGFNSDGNANGLGLTGSGTGTGYYLDNLSVQVVPEPSSLALMVSAGLGCVCLMRRRRTVG